MLEGSYTRSKQLIDLEAKHLLHLVLLQKRHFKKYCYCVPFTHLRKGQKACSKAYKFCVDLYKGIYVPVKVLVISRAVSSGKLRIKLLVILKCFYVCPTVTSSVCIFISVYAYTVLFSLALILTYLVT